MLKEPTTTNLSFSFEEIDLLEQVDLLRLEVGRLHAREKKAEAGQFFTPAPLARFMASLFKRQPSTVRILDAGAGVGSLFAACIGEICARESRPEQISVVAYEIDPELIEHLETSLHLCQATCQQAGISFIGKIKQEDFIEAGVELLRETLFLSQDEKIEFVNKQSLINL